MYEAGSALTGLSCFITPDLAQDLANDIMTLVSERTYTCICTYIQYMDAVHS